MSLIVALGEELARLDNQPAGSNRAGFLGIYECRRLIADRTVNIIDCDTDEAIISVYQEFNQDSRKQTVLFSNDYGFIDRSIDTGVPAHHAKYPVDIP